jgi:hypothetical protein
MKVSGRNLRSLLAQGGRPPAEVRDHLVKFWALGYGSMINDHYGRGHPFDHVELWGKDRLPLVLVGHPYEVWGEAFETLDGLRRLGLSVSIDGRGWYGHGTVQVRVDHGETLRRAFPRDGGPGLDPEGD